MWLIRCYLDNGQFAVERRVPELLVGRGAKLPGDGRNGNGGDDRRGDNEEPAVTHFSEVRLHSCSRCDWSVDSLVKQKLRRPTCPLLYSTYSLASLVMQIFAEADRTMAKRRLNSLHSSQYVSHACTTLCIYTVCPISAVVGYSIVTYSWPKSAYDVHFFPQTGLTANLSSHHSRNNTCSLMILLTQERRYAHHTIRT